MRCSAVAFALLGVALACDQGTAPTPAELPPPTPNAAGALTYLSEKTVTREGTAKQTVEFTLDERDHSLFMEPFVLHVQQGGERSINARVLVDGLPVLVRGDFAVMGPDPYSLEIPVSPTSVITVELDGQAGGAVTLRVDAPLQPAPVITITSPSRHSTGTGAFLQQGTLDPSAVQITGTACHARYPITQLEIAGVAVSVPGTNLCEAFSVAQQSRWGMTIITGSARNSRGRQGAVVQAYTRGPEHYGIPDAGDGQTAVRGFYSHLTQPALDDGSRTDLDDLATFIKRAIDLTPLVIPASTAVPCNDVFEVSIPQQTPARAVAINALTATATHLAIDISINNPSVAIVVRADPLQPFDDNCDGTVIENAVFSATAIRVTANLRASAKPAGQAPGVVVSVENPQVTISGAGATSTTAFVGDLLSGLTNLSASLISGVFGDFILDLMAPSMSDLLNSLAPTVSTQFQLNGATVDVESGLATIQHGFDFLRLGVFGLVAPVTQPGGVVAPRGPLRAVCGSVANPCPGNQVPMPPFNPGANAFAVAVHQDMLNHTLWSAWRAGAFSATLPSLSLNATMPPVSMATTAGDPMGELRWGDVRVTATFDPAEFAAPPGDLVDVECWVSATVRGGLEFSNSTGQLALIDVIVSIDVQLIGDPLPFSEAAVRAAIAARLEAPLTQFTRDGLAVVPIPRGNLRIANVNVTRNGFFYVLGGTLQ